MAYAGAVFADALMRALNGETGVVSLSFVFLLRKWTSTLMQSC